MKYIITLNKVKGSDLEDVGFRAVDLALLREKRLNIPLTFVINNQAFEDFLNENGLKAKIEKAFQNKKGADAYEEVLEFFAEAVFPRQLEEELFEAYESLAIDPGATASSIVSEWDFPFVTLIRAPSYLYDTGDNEGIIHNIRGKGGVADALKLVWASVFSPESVAYRKKIGIADSFGIGVLVQKMKRLTQSAISYSCLDDNENTIFVKSFVGLPDYASEKEILGKDHHLVDRDSLMINKADIRVQEYGLERNMKTHDVTRCELGERGSRQKLDDRQVSEVARITKRAKSFIGKDLKLQIGVRDNYTYVLLADRLVPGQKRVVKEEEKVELKVDDGGKKVMEHQHQVSAAKKEAEEREGRKGREEREKEKGPLEMPDIISKEEAEEKAREELEKEGVGEEELMADDVGVNDVDEGLKEDLGFLDKIEEENRAEPEKGPKEAEQEVNEVNLLGELIRVKDVVEKMERYAHQDNKEAYALEVNRLKKLLSRED